MDINDFSKTHNVPVTTLRFYIKLGLIRPKKRSESWYFTQEDSLRLKDIVLYKKCNFSLNSIKQLLDLSYSSNAKETFSLKKILALLKNERTRLEKEHIELTGALKRLDLEYYPNDNTTENVISIPFRLFLLIACPYCDLTLNWNNIMISQNAVFKGDGHCTCGFTAEINDGILFCNSEPIIKSVDVNLDTIRKRTARDTSTIEKYFLWLFNHLCKKELKRKIMFEDTINLICFTLKALPLMADPPDIILADSSEEAIRYCAKALNGIKPNSDVLLIVDDGVHHPIKKGSLDIVVDYCSSEIVQSYGYSSVFSLMRNYMKPNSIVLGRFSYIYKRKGYISNYVTPTSTIRYNLKVLQNSMLENKIHIIQDYIGKENLDPSVYDGSEPGDIIRPYVFWGHSLDDATWSQLDEGPLHSEF